MNIEKKWKLILDRIRQEVSVDSYRNVAATIGVNYSTLWRVMNDERSPNIGIVIQLERWYDKC